MIDKNKKYRIEKLYGYCDLSQIYRKEDDKIIVVGIRKDYSRDGKLESVKYSGIGEITFK